MNSTGKVFLWAAGIVGSIVLVVSLSFLSWGFSKAANVANQTADSAISSYEEFQEMYNTCQQLNTDLGTIRDTPNNDPMFSSFSKGAMIAAKREQLSRWVNEYNAKSRMWNHSLWKAKSLPYELNVHDFSNYDNH